MAIDPPLAKRTLYLGKQTTDPTPTETGCWYYNTASNVFRYWNGAEWVAYPAGEWDKTGTTTLIVAEGGDYAMNITAPSLAMIDYIVSIDLDTDPATDPGSITNKSINGNIVGFTLVGVGQGTTIVGKLTAVGGFAS